MTTNSADMERGGKPPLPGARQGGASVEELDDYLGTLSVVPDGFQRRAMQSVSAGRSVLVSAPTGSGKTLVADFAAWRALRHGGKAFYTTPIKALSNQKYEQLAAEHGEDRVGLLTGDISHHPSAPLVVMTTEVLRNMLFSRSVALVDLEVVVLDEVHYLEDATRGSVWEEVIVLTPPSVTFVCLSATVHNAEDFGAWIRSVRGATDIVVEARRTVETVHHVAVSRRGRDGVVLQPLLKDGRTSPEVGDLDRGRGRGPSSRWRVPRRSELVEALSEADMLPGITFIFSRAGCDDAARNCMEDGLRLTTGPRRDRLRSIVEECVEQLGDDDLATLGYGRWLATLEAGFAAHHAGMVPAFRRAVERCFGAGLLPMVFATETLALGINMPARTVVLDRLTKFRGSGRSALHAGEYRQLTGRAGRRGIDTVGHAVVRWSPATSVAAAAAIATAPPPDLVSSFHPTYNLVVNLVRRWSKEDAMALLRSSYGQWQAPPGSHSLLDEFDRRFALLEERGHVDGWRLTDAGFVLARFSHQSELIATEALRLGLFDGVTAPQLAGIASALVFERRRQGDADEVPAPLSIADRLGELCALASEVRGEERRFDLHRSKRPDTGLARTAMAWAEGRSLSSALEPGAVAPGDFVRAMRQLVDLLHQIHGAVEGQSDGEGSGGGNGSSAPSVAALAAQLVNRGVVTADPPQVDGVRADGGSPVLM